MVLIHPKLTDYGALYVAYLMAIRQEWKSRLYVTYIFGSHTHGVLILAALYATYILWFIYNIKFATCKPSTI